MNDNTRGVSRSRIFCKRPCVPSDFRARPAPNPCEAPAGVCVVKAGRRPRFTLELPPERLREILDFLPEAKSILGHGDVPECDIPDVLQTLTISLIRRSKRRMARGLPGLAQEPLHFARACARWTALTYRRKRARRPEAVVDVWNVPSIHPVVTDEEAIQPRRDHDLDVLAAYTPPSCWRVFYARAVLGVPLVAIAAAEGIPTATAHNRMRLARIDLQKPACRAVCSAHRAYRPPPRPHRTRRPRAVSRRTN